MIASLPAHSSVSWNSFSWKYFFFSSSKWNTYRRIGTTYIELHTSRRPKVVRFKTKLCIIRRDDIYYLNRPLHISNWHTGGVSESERETMVHKPINQMVVWAIEWPQKRRTKSSCSFRQWNVLVATQPIIIGGAFTHTHTHIQLVDRTIRYVYMYLLCAHGQKHTHSSNVICISKRNFIPHVNSMAGSECLLV